MDTERDVLNQIRDRIVHAVPQVRLGCRYVVVIAGGPAAGKTTLASQLLSVLKSRGLTGQLLPMDGFHLSRENLDENGLGEQKGSPSTFDVEGYLSCLTLASNGSRLTAPSYSRQLHKPIVNAYPFGPQHKVVVSEGNYLLLDTPPWRHVRSVADLTIFIDSSERLCAERLLARHIMGGRSRAEAQHKIELVDLPNHRLIRRNRLPPDIVLMADDLVDR